MTHIRLCILPLLLLLPLAACVATSPARDAAPPADGLGREKQALVYLDVVDGLIRQGRGAAALAFLDRYAADGRSLPPRYWLLRGQALRGEKQDAAALAAFAQLDRTPLAGQGWNGKGLVAAAQGDWRAAVQHFARAAGLDPASGEFLNNLGYAQLKLGQTGAALARLRQAHELDPGSGPARVNLIAALMLSGDGPGARALLDAIGDARDRAGNEAAARAALAEFKPEKESRS